MGAAPRRGAFDGELIGARVLPFGMAEGDRVYIAAPAMRSTRAASDNVPPEVVIH
jgi:hypothetical protein